MTTNTPVKPYYYEIDCKVTKCNGFDIIREAKRLGWQNAGGFYLSSEASAFLRVHGYKVGYKLQLKTNGKQRSK